MVRVSIVALALASCLPTVFSHPANSPRDKPFGCGAEPSDDFVAKAKELAGIESSRSANFGAKTTGASSNISLTAPVLQIQTYFHVVAISKSLSGGYVPSSTLTKQLTVLNDDYAPQGIEFVLAGQDWTINKNWANNKNELAMKKTLRKGDYKALNIYFLYNLEDGNLGVCPFPTNVTTGSDDFYLDGCRVLYSTAPGGSLTNFDQGKTATHEVGHWFGLMHTFENGCDGDGDLIADTPASASSSSGCPTGRDSCTSDPGEDPIHNYMDYSYDSCYEQFTTDQRTRMFHMYESFRA